MVEITFRDQQVEVVIDQVIVEPEVNYTCIEWHFEDQAMNDLELTNEEEDNIQDLLWNKHYEGSSYAGY